MKYKLATTAGVVTVALVASTLSISGFARKPAAAAALPAGAWSLVAYGPRSTDDVVLKWDEQLLSAIRAYPAKTGPTITSRALAVAHTAMYEAWAAYDPKAKGTRPDGPTQQASNTDANKKEAISYAAYRALIDLFPASQFPSTTAPPATHAYSTPDGLMTALGYDTSVTTTEGTSPAAVGNKAAQAVLNYRHHDGSNQLGTDPGTPADAIGTPYADNTSYKPVNDWNKVVDRWRWQPLCVPTPPPGATSCAGTVQKATTPQWANIVPFAPNSAQYQIPGPRKTATDTVTALADTSNLDDVKKVKAEYWADGPQTEFPPGHTAVFAQAISRRYGFSLDKNVQMFFALGNALMDAGIAAWGQKYKYDWVRPITAIREQYKGKMINSWLGPNNGFGTVPAEQWIPYQALNVVTPPFPEYTSGHSTFTAAGSQVLRSYMSSDNFGAYVTFAKDSSKFESNTPASEVTLYWSTFTAAADEAGWSRRYGGIHFYSGDLQGRALGDNLGKGALSQARSYIQGTIGH